MRACLTGNSGLPVVTGIAVFAFLCGGGFWVLKSRASNPSKDKHTDADVEEGEDRISELPDDVMSLIISLLDAEDAIRTSILSRRWRHAYTFTTQVRFSCFHMSSGPPFFPDHTRGKSGRLQTKVVRAVDTILQHHSGSKIMSFKLVCCYGVCVSKAFRRWMDSVGRLGVERLTIAPCLPYHIQQGNHPVFSFHFPPEASSLKHLRLKFGSFRTANRNALEILELDFVTLTSKAVKRLLSNCSSLQSLKFEYCVLPSKLSIHGPDLRLKSLTVYHCYKVAEGCKTARVIDNLSNLRQLDLFLEDRNELDLLELATILDVCPLLHKFHLAMSMPSTFNGKRANSRVFRRHTMLKEVEFSGFSGTENEYNFIFYIFDNVVSLERLSIFVHFRFYEVDDGRWLATYSDDKKKHRIIRKRLQRKAISKNTEIIIA